MDDSRVTLLGMPLDANLDADSVVQNLLKPPILLTYLNPFAWHIVRQNEHYLNDLNAMDLVVCDGIGIKKALQKFTSHDTAILTPDDSAIAPAYLKAFQQRGSRICLVGTQQAEIDRAVSALKLKYPGINILAAFPGYAEGPVAAREFILESEPEVVLVGMGMGQQESFLLSLRRNGWMGTGIAVGAYFDRLANPNVDYPAWSIKYNYCSTASVLPQAIPCRLSSFHKAICDSGCPTGILKKMRVVRVEMLMVNSNG
jgi:N-acetylglucosaminyldiphosphoundecaprenol N-acetyl-beta-D-mannosaminyltransferase